MRLKIFAVYDSKVGAFMSPFFERSTGGAIRAFADAAGKDGSQFGAHSADFALFEFGSWDDDSGKFELLAAPLNLGLAQQFLVKE